MKSQVVSIVEGHYSMGFGALANSLVHAGYRGPFTVFGKAEEPEWIVRFNGHLVSVDSALRIDYRQFQTDYHLSALKADAMRQVFDSTDAEAVYYFDPDIVVGASWGFFERWASNGVALVEDGNFGSMPPDHPHRFTWAEQMAKHGHRVLRPMSRYYNSGFVGMMREHQDLLPIWDAFTHGIGDVYDLKHFQAGKREDPYMGTDQDTLNMAVMATETPLSTVGPDGMALHGWGYIMYHAVGSPKPWKRSHLKEALRARKPSLCEQKWLEHSRDPIPVFTAWQYRWQRAMLRAATFLGRFYSR